MRKSTLYKLILGNLAERIFAAGILVAVIFAERIFHRRHFLPTRIFAEEDFRQTEYSPNTFFAERIFRRQTFPRNFFSLKTSLKCRL